MLTSTLTTERARPAPIERRRNFRLRERFDIALTLLRPILAQDGEAQGARYFRAFSRLHERFPEMTQNELEALVVAVLHALHSR